eukprot:GHVQ01002642.1.p1 GENE.GHVQ01002642.1~~GHVQ01002642.1.p1  ORF type:complete len:503 (+),score=89.50 GHVQ01002642.1:130-1638(+)
MEADGGVATATPAVATTPPPMTICRQVEGPHTAVELVSPTGESARVDFSFARPEDQSSWQDIYDSSVLQHWLRPYGTALSNPKGLRLHSAVILSVYKRIDATTGASHISSIQLDANVTNEHGERIPGDIRLRGPKCALIVLLRNTENSKDMCLFVKQPRATIGESEFLEIPECHLEDSGQFIGPSVDLLEQTLNVSLNRNCTVSLTGLAFGAKSEGVCTSPASSDERVHLYLYRNNLPPAEMATLERKLNGRRSGGVGGGAAVDSEKGEGEEQQEAVVVKADDDSPHDKEGLQLRLITLGDAWRSTCDARSMVALFLVHELRYHARMPRYKPPREALNGTYQSAKKVANFVKIADLEPTTAGVSIRGKVLKKLEIEDEGARSGGRDGGRKFGKYGALVVGDDSAIIGLRVSADHLELCESLAPGMPVVVRNSKIDMSDGHMKLLVDRWGKISTTIDEEDLHEFSFTINESVDISRAEYELVVTDDMDSVRTGGVREEEMQLR